jgi:hypothetical protein
MKKELLELLFQSCLLYHFSFSADVLLVKEALKAAMRIFPAVCIVR